MRVIDAGHMYELNHLDGSGCTLSACICPTDCDCQDWENGYVSENCPIHNEVPDPYPNCPAEHPVFDSYRIAPWPTPNTPSGGPNTKSTVKHTGGMDLDGSGKQVLTFVKRMGPKYPGNESAYEGTNLQECLRALIDRVNYLDRQIPHVANRRILWGLRFALRELEVRAADRHGRPMSDAFMLAAEPEAYPVCAKCGHVECTEVSHG